MLQRHWPKIGLKVLEVLILFHGEGYYFLWWAANEGQGFTVFNST